MQVEHLLRCQLALSVHDPDGRPVDATGERMHVMHLLMENADTAGALCSKVASVWAYGMASDSSRARARLMACRRAAAGRAG